MKNIIVSNDIIPVGEFKTGLSKCLKNIRNTGQHLIITQNGKPAGVLLSPSEYDELVHEKLFIESVNRGLSDAKSGKIYSTNQLKKELIRRRTSGKS
jgi:prevent-host-death family protein